MRASTGTEVRVSEIESKDAEFSAAEKGGKGMALKIFTGAKPFPKALIKPFDITEMGMLPLTQESLVGILFLQDKKEG